MSFQTAWDQAVNHQANAVVMQTAILRQKAQSALGYHPHQGFKVLQPPDYSQTAWPYIIHHLPSGRADEDPPTFDHVSTMHLGDGISVQDSSDFGPHTGLHLPENLRAYCQKRNANASVLVQHAANGQGFYVDTAGGVPHVTRPDGGQVFQVVRRASSLHQWPLQHPDGPLAVSYEQTVRHLQATSNANIQIGSWGYFRDVYTNQSIAYVWLNHDTRGRGIELENVLHDTHVYFVTGWMRNNPHLRVGPNSGPLVEYPHPWRPYQFIFDPPLLMEAVGRINDACASKNGGTCPRPLSIDPAHWFLTSYHLFMEYVGKDGHVKVAGAFRNLQLGRITGYQRPHY